MRKFRVLCFLLMINLCAAPFLRADNSDPSELFLSAYMAVQSGEKLEDAGKYKLALQKYRYAVSLLQQIHDKTPDWQPLIVDYRSKKTAEAIAKVEQRISLEGPGSTKEDVEPALPEKTDENAPTVSVSPATPDMSSTPSTTTQDNGTDVFENGTIKDMRARYEAMQRELFDTKRKYASVQQEKEELAVKLDDAVKQIDKLRVNETQLKSQLSQAEEAYKNSVADKTKDTEGQKQLKDEVARLQEALKDAEAERDAAQDANSEVMQKIKGLKGERDDAIKQLDDAKDSLAKAKEAQQQVDKLMADNASLMKKLNDAEQTIAQFNSSAPAKDAEIANLKKEVNDTKDQLNAALKQSQENLDSMNDLQAQLESATTELSQIKSGAVSADDRKKLADENELLKGIVIRERKEEARRDQEKKLALDELGKLHVQSQSLADKISYLGEPVVKLTDQERALFKQPQIAINDSDISIATQQPVASPTPVTMPDTAPTPGPMPDNTPAPLPSNTPADNTGMSVPAASPAASPATDTGSSPAASPAPSTDGTSSPDTAEPHVQTSITPPVSKELIPQANEAKEKFEQGNYAQAEKIYTAMLSQEPKNIYILSNLGVVRFRSGKLKPAEETFRKAIAIAPDDAFSHRTLGIVYFTQGKLDEAVGELTKALAINSKDPIAHNYLGITCGSKGWQEAARKELETAVSLDPNYADAHFNLAVIYLTTPPEDKVGAGKHYKRALELGAEPDNNLEQMLNKK